MKKVQIKGKLQLNKMQIASISDLHMAQIVGGDGGGSAYACTGGGSGTNANCMTAKTCDFDVPTINDSCLCKTGNTTFGANCGWNGWWH